MMYMYKSSALSFQTQAQSKKGIKNVFFTEGASVGVNTEELDKFINEQAIDGWELVTYSPLISQEHITFIITFKKKK